MSTRRSTLPAARRCPPQPGALASLSLLLLAALAPQTRAALMVSNLANSTNGSTAVNDFDSGLRIGRDLGASFTTGTEATSLQSVTLSMAAGTHLGGSFSVKLFSTLGSTVPDADLGVTFTGSANPATAGLYTYTSSAYQLAPLTTYWVVAAVAHASPDKQYKWNFTNTLSETSPSGWTMGDDIADQTTYDGQVGTWATAYTGVAVKFSVDATAVPEPVSAVAWFGGLGLAAVWRRRRRTVPN